MKPKKESFFWTSYSDLMTSLFFIMLVLFVLTISLLHSKVVATENELAKIRKLNESIQTIDSNYFAYNEDYQRHTLKNVQVSFETNSDKITDIDSVSLSRLENAGRAIVSFMQKAKRDIPGAQYLLIVEGQSSRDYYVGNYELSYRRALSLVKYWTTKGIIFDDLPCEVIISGSGQASSFRILPDDKYNKENQRFVIHIIPKPGNF